ncbi:tRNA pseudouridine(55) synthase TruB [Cohnella faecalis]|uniref:tRNA pseudouridine synthase B n=1 Tax=Cohnella faecalis TaxID=2315694 RepID=A0A398CPV8_9BACL|nr:tRNA pseudouridine(55) synthase TruB [Cohnella faecalis]RIE03329.1 tRNA pseudouridine(55) synthase TruB [Cohnella faecalis]
MRKRLPANSDGVLGVLKPKGWTSHDIVAKVRGLTGIRRIGHTGTLDPAVTGVLPLCIGRATRFVEYLQEMPKTYEARLRFGLSTDTEDLSGIVMEERDASHLTEVQMRSAVLSFIGDIEQVPPMVSAVKVDGKRLYELARQGVTVERKARPVTIHDLEVLEVTAGVAHPEIRFSVRCSKGTYIRTLCVDIGASLGVPAVMAELVRTESASLRESDCVTLEQIADLMELGTLENRLLRADRLLVHLPHTTAASPESEYALQGKALQAIRLRPVPDSEGIWRVYRSDGTFIGLFDYNRETGALRPVKVFHPQDGE